MNEINRGELARQVTDNPVYQEAFTALKASLIDSFQNTKFKETAERDEVWRKMQTVNYVEGYLEEIMETGKLARITAADKLRKVVGM